MDRQRSELDWRGILSSLQETLEDVAFTLQIGQETGVRADILALDAFDILDRFISGIKMDLGL